MKTTEDVLIKMLTDQNIEAQSQKETNQVYFVLKHENQNFPAFLRPLHDGNLLQIMVFIPALMEKTGSVSLARFLHLANKELDMPGFGMDESSQTVFYRIVVPTIDQKMDDTLFKIYIKTCQDVCATFSVIIQALCIGAMTMDDILNEMKATPVPAKK